MNPPGPPQPGQQPTPEQIQMMQQQLAAEAQRRGLTVPQYIEQLKAQAMQQAQMQQQAQQQQQQQQQQVPINPQGPPNPAAIAVANFLKAQDLKPRTCILDEKRKDMFRVKRAIRALQSTAYVKARSKNPLLPEVTDRASAENTFKLLPLSLLALRVSKVDPSGHEGHNHAKPKRVKGLWTVRIEQHQETDDDHHYVWLYEGSQWKTKLYAVGALLGVIAIVLFPLWPLVIRQGVWYLSMGMLGLIGLFFGMAIFRLILFIITMFAAPPGLWLYPNLFEDVGFFDSFRPVWAWQETPEDIKAKKRAKKAKKLEKAEKRAALAKANGKAKHVHDHEHSHDHSHDHHDHSHDHHDHSHEHTHEKPSAPTTPAPVNSAPQATGLATPSSGGMVQRTFHASVEEADDE
ncbi:translocation protein [Delitschia confertaspora ATCC 74209]|uniref:Translocation protein SEC62 n=1 Tax=Delitschia confertaspora ATCC 74209 TaxID=1513339 RepID=A0A9P4JEG9_9PLEO|nr:translocation protein [Delitschia confertaspora ATCC 74209]